MFADWLDGLSDNIAKANILNRLAGAQLGNFGDCEPVVDGVSEMRIHSGAGNRIYYVRTGKILLAVVYVLLCGGNKANQKRDIATAIKLARDFKTDAL